MLSSAIVFDFFIITSALVAIAIISIAFFAIDYIRVLLYVEVAVLSINLNFVFSSIVLDDPLAQIFVVFILSVVAAESAIALSIFVLVYKSRGSMLVFLPFIFSENGFG